MPGNRLAGLRAACLALVVGSLALGLTVIVTVAIPLRQTDPVAATVAFLLAVVAFVLARCGRRPRGAEQAEVGVIPPEQEGHDVTSSLRARSVAVAVLALTAVLAACSSSPAPTPAGASAASPPPAVPAPVAVPAGQHLVLTATVKQGSQVYVCRGTAWALKQPAAVLAAPTTDVLHDAGPRWTATVDGSSVTGAQVAAAPVPGSASDLLVRASGHDGQGVMSGVDFVQRLGVRGGAAPAGACTDGARQAVGYSAEYRFWAPGT